MYVPVYGTYCKHTKVITKHSSFHLHQVIYGVIYLLYLKNKPFVLINNSYEVLFK